jgi:hypothetical protein
MCADDVKLYSIVTTDDKSLVTGCLGQVTGLVTYVTVEYYKKCMALELSNKNNLSCNYTLNDTNISKSSASKDLCVIIDHKLSFTLHIYVIVSRAHARASLIHD